MADINDDIRNHYRDAYRAEVLKQNDFAADVERTRRQFKDEFSKNKSVLQAAAFFGCGLLGAGALLFPFGIALLAAGKALSLLSAAIAGAALPLTGFAIFKVSKDIVDGRVEDALNRDIESGVLVTKYNAKKNAATPAQETSALAPAGLTAEAFDGAASVAKKSIPLYVPSAVPYVRGM